MALNAEILELIDTLEAIRFLTNAFEGEQADTVAMARKELPLLNRYGKMRLRTQLRKSVNEIRRHYGAVASNSRLREMLIEARRYRGLAYLPKRFVDTGLFTHYERVFSRWPFIPDHALVVFDGHTLRPTSSIYLAEAALFDDALHMLERARVFQKGIIDFRKRDREDQNLLQTYLRAAATATFQTLEAYLNGTAYDCFMERHGSLEIEDHDLLAEWNSGKARRAFVSFERKLREYPRIAVRAKRGVIDLSDWACVGFIVETGKSLRDAITHPSPFVDPKTKRKEKTFWMAGINLEIVERLVHSAREYMVAVESALTGNPQRSAPWLFQDDPG